MATGPVHENGFLNAATVSVQHFRGGGGRPVFGLWATYSVAASHLHRDSALAHAAQLSFPLPLRDSAGFTPASRLTNPDQGLTCTSLFYIKTLCRRVSEAFCRIKRCARYSQSVGLKFSMAQDIVGKFLGLSKWRVKRESGETPELPRSGKQVRTPKRH